ncbi:MAG: DUF4491 family protein [Bacteroidales bacterium]|jgi:branched-subunit amino acid transport protein|nr:DUF4491 family protein [Bacteroidales bacterium]
MNAITEFISTYNLTGVLIGLCTFFIIGIFHPLVTKGEYYFGVKIWWAFLIAGVATFIAALAVRNIFGSICLGVVSFSCFWSILEVFHQKKRVEKGWFPKNPKRK